MKKRVTLVLMFVLLVGCTNRNIPQSSHPTDTATTPAIQASPIENKTVWSIYDPDPDHLWNRVFRQFYQRTSVNGEIYGADELDPLLWLDSTYLLDGTSHQQAIKVLDEFLTTHAEVLIHDPLKRAIFQRDLWAVFDWAASQKEPFISERQALTTRLAQIIRRVALSKEEILSLPDNYALEIEAKTFPASPSPDYPEIAFLPSDIFQPNSAWVPMGREGGPIAMTHTEAFPFFGRSVFLVYVRSPDGRPATLDFIESLNTEPNPITAIGLDVALVRRMLSIDNDGDLILSPLIETVQIRHFSQTQNFHEFELNRVRLFDGFGSGLMLKTELFLLFMSHGDVFEMPNRPTQRATIPQICRACHFNVLPGAKTGEVQSIISYSRQPFALPDNSQPVLSATTITDETQIIIEWKQNHETWKLLESFWQREYP